MTVPVGTAPRTRKHGALQFSYSEFITDADVSKQNRQRLQLLPKPQLV